MAFPFSPHYQRFPFIWPQRFSSLYPSRSLHSPQHLSNAIFFISIFPLRIIFTLFPDDLYGSSSFASLMSDSHKQVTRSRLSSRYAQPILELNSYPEARRASHISATFLATSSTTTDKIPASQRSFKRKLRSRRGDLQGVGVKMWGIVCLMSRCLVVSECWRRLVTHCCISRTL